MEMKDLALPSLNRFASDYLQNRLEAEDYFHYDLSKPDIYRDRYDELMNRAFSRRELSDYIQRYMSRFSSSEAVKGNIERLCRDDSVVVIGGQQAGLLTGPLYTIHKVISIVKLAKEQEKELGRPVIPVFWIAGEDHDLAEVNHVYVMKNGKPHKKTYPSYQPYKTMVSDVELESDKAEKWFEEIIETYGETAFTNKLLINMKETIRESKTFVDFFARLIHEWFHEYGLLLVDAADPELRQIEKGHFVSMIKKSERIAEVVEDQQSFMHAKGYPKMIEMDKQAANLFYYDPEKKDRCLLERVEGGFSGKNTEASFSEAELLMIANNHPERLSNNVITRPLMQEMLFPVLAFISGPGEIAYWAELKRAFELFSMKMPPIIPRLNITIVERGVQTDLEEMELTLDTVLTEGTVNAVKRYLEAVEDKITADLFENLKSQLEENHKKLSDHAVSLDKGLEPMLNKNIEFIQRQLDFIYGRIGDRTKERHSVTLKKYERIAHSLYPLESPQERIWNAFYYLNQYGPEFIRDIMKLDYQFNNQHKLIFI
ncbi:bacillithiol biosynthesis cysteine-adding enzyme BshC [Peribacillus muralis]|uniref:bacillithiol biosynthesis cysteine-adding enzyme BshC n=1 Tax=Peribacillus muralis TaxID=264697 RepID=UPI001F4E45E7|nr:bacillithiol biosynthesis cysteine-adding enzyme BshC [Peribacillus muralis]MCK1992578.1 bacillithiol biosynthesis cysteine-adding enzyme BshC [Peribacillus muralis]MCK2013134.1 bacillithiol biosynthesis cysteine-adding enzyme BshC [Peribacillus muralis]